jgi:hypothetical protein
MTRTPGRLAAALVVAQLVVAAVVVWRLVEAGYWAADDPGSTLAPPPHSDGYRFGFVVIALSVLVVTPATLLALAVARRFAWVVPVLGVAWVVVAAVYFFTTYERPIPSVVG